MGYAPLWADEPIRAIIALHMEQTGEYIVPTINGDVYLNKPPLYNWIVLGAFKLFGSHEEWVVRFPAVISILLFGLYIYRVTLKELKDRNLALISSLGMITTGNLLFWSSYLGHIDVTYSLVVYASFIVIYRGIRDNRWLEMFLVSYLLCFIGFMMKGLPSLVFQAFTIAAYAIYSRKWKKLFSIQHIAGILVFVNLLVIYLFLYSEKASVTELITRLWSESSQRTVTDQSVWKSISHLFMFPVKFIVDMAPWSLLLLLLVKKSIRKLAFYHPFTRFLALTFAVNIVVYWLAPDYRARYVFMLMPIPIIMSLYGLILKDEGIKEKIDKYLLIVSQYLIVGIILFSVYFTLSKEDFGTALLISLAAIWLLTLRIYPQMSFKGWKFFIVNLLLIRVLFSFVVIPDRFDEYNEYVIEKHEGQRIGMITEGQPLAMYHSNVNLTMSWYIENVRNEELKTKRDGDHFSFDEFYLVPAEVLKDSTNYTTYFSFTRRYLHKPFKLVKFHRYFPEMPKAEQ